MASALIRSLTPVLDDVRRSDPGVSFHVRDDEIEELSHRIERAMLWASDGSGTSIQIDRGDSDADRVAYLAGVVQDLIIEDFTLLPWPVCPHHQQGGHPLVAANRDGNALWKCPTADVGLARIGNLSR